MSNRELIIRELIIEDLLLFRELNPPKGYCPMIDLEWIKWDDIDYKCKCFCYKLWPISNEKKDCPCHYLPKKDVISRINESFFKT